MPYQDLIVLKFGSSILTGEEALPLVVGEIYQALRRGHRVLAVVSAFSGTTDRLSDRARRVTGEPNPDALAELLATGERTAAALLVLHLERAGIRALLLDPARVGPVTRGPLNDATPISLDDGGILRALEARPVAVLPGFIGRDASGATSLLGRGGSDLSAIFAAHQLGAAHCRLLKDVNGLYEHDPARPGPAPSRFRTITFEQALTLDPRIIQPKGVRYAQDCGLAFEVAAPGDPARTLVGASRTALAGPAAARPRGPLRIALLGLGTVGLGVYRQLAARPDAFELTRIAVRDIDKHRAQVPSALLTTDPWEVVAAPYDVLIELIGGRDPAAPLIEHALAAGKDVVTANKEIVALIGARLERTAARSGSLLRYSAAVGGALPAIEVVELLAATGPIRSIQGVLNGTTNYILDRLAAGADAASSLAEAQARGFAESDPTLDLNGFDAACKLAILTRAAFGVPTDAAAIDRSGIEQLDPAEIRAAQATGRTIRLVASCRMTGEGPVPRVAPCALPTDHPLAAAHGAGNVLIIEPEHGPPVILHGTGAGRWPTSESVLADLTDIARCRRRESATSLASAAV